jgi:hypothetical protein
MTMIDDPIVEEIRAYRKAFAEAHGNDLLKIAKAIQERGSVSKAPRIRLEPKRLADLEKVSS